MFISWCYVILQPSAQVSVAVFLLFLVSKNYLRKISGKIPKNSRRPNFMRGPRSQKEASHKVVPQHGAVARGYPAGPSCDAASCAPSRCPSAYIYIVRDAKPTWTDPFSPISILSRRRHGNQSRALFGYSTRVGNRCRRHLHQPCCIHDDMWVVPSWTTGLWQ